MMISKGKVGMVSGTKAMLRVASSSQHAAQGQPQSGSSTVAPTKPLIAAGIHITHHIMDACGL
jgi:hypothetical protein